MGGAPSEVQRQEAKKCQGKGYGGGLPSAPPHCKCVHFGVVCLTNFGCKKILSPQYFLLGMPPCSPGIDNSVVHSAPPILPADRHCARYKFSYRNIINEFDNIKPCQHHGVV